MSDSATTMAGKARQRENSRKMARLYNASQGRLCQCADCKAKRTAPRERDESWARMEREAEARSLARKNNTWRW